MSIPACCLIELLPPSDDSSACGLTGLPAGADCGACIPPAGICSAFVPPHHAACAPPRYVV